MMETKELTRIRRNLGRFVKQFDDCIKTAPSRKHLRTYIRGQISNLERKSIEPIALDAGVAPRTLQEFLGFHRWDHEKVLSRVQEIVMRDHADENAIAIVDETGFAKKGDKTPGVQRQYCGATGKVDNCVMTVNLGYSAGDFYTLIDSDLYLPKEAWHKDRERCSEAGIPDEVVYRPKWQIALEQIDRAIQNDVRFAYLTADEAYGRCAAFRNTVDESGLIYVVEVPCDTTGWTKKPRVVSADTYSGSGRPPTKPHVAPGTPPARRVDKLWRRGGPRWQMFHIKDTEKGPVVWEVRATRFFVAEEWLPGEEGWLIVARNVLDGQVKYFLSNASADTPIEVLLHVAFSRWHIERSFKDAKGQVGMDHFEVRRYLALTRHMILSMVSLLFLVKETRKLREKKLVVERTPSADGCGGAT